jgi:hypothetical protein
MSRKRGKLYTARLPEVEKNQLFNNEKLRWSIKEKSK